MTPKGGLGRGLKALIKEETSVEEPVGKESAGVSSVPLAQIARSSLQPRQKFSEDGMTDLVNSIKERGVVQPLLVRKKEGKYELIAGERRLRAAEKAGLAEIPVIVREATDQDAFELALIENLQREDLNALEEAEGYRTLIARFGMTQERVAERVGKSRASVANSIRLLDLPKEIKALLAEGKLSPGHAKVLLSVEILEEQILLAGQIVREGLSVRNLEKLVEKSKQAPRKPRAMREDLPRAYVAHISDMLRRLLGTSVRVTPSRTLANGKKAKGSVEIDFFSVEDLDRILAILGVSENEDQQRGSHP